ncbi:MAG: SprT family zinc-dependent metalloprotease [Alphaproteobacteria bacterium]|jgi:hypothetical protein|nr:SprT family zinc-dependent metalloprotease [Alphaproteobacteria bacterium]MDP6254995.1 SprT family zinc-dependent metalloprotease [Alphaproteobacteria bacterium]MDP7054487.1 SprT family zinc-dependent metalloprotease [Alphaproteobacteria bacterium]MDP7231002.1 SprT family zinc-dependent metalloprotease [Alphaproteobacteria bacterium]MDP7462210.1 SprT family zinc-dependent metalloprotease [Alphaproteobacteria bacterium]|tara:strand:+ start:3972 stop:4679 length:708 start_codon:yes stop_codon:yes gene_type:complete
MNFDPNLKFDFEVKRSTRRKTLCLQIRDGHVQVMVPARTPERQITALVNKHTDWIEKKLAEQAARPKAPSRSYVNGEIYFFLGQEHELEIVDGAPWPAKIVRGKLVVTIQKRLSDLERQAKVKQRLHELYQQAALEEFQTRTEYYGRRLFVRASDIRVKSYKRRWGSCSNNGELSYNWRLVIAPAAVLDYVAAHEVSHLVEHNHSLEFWRIVEELMPSYREQKVWLKLNGGTLAI